ncbi:MAG: hypothetical protein K2M97_04580 [Muribaculaceae bacterium]|nr:hypothetical protein [Muribaculaceae bacterium]
MKNLLIIIALLLGLTACIEDGFTTSPSDQPRFSTDTVAMGVQFAGRPSPTYMLTIRNPHSKQLMLSSVRMRSGEHFRINVDGFSSNGFADVEIRPHDSIYVFVEGTFPPTGLLGAQRVTDFLDVTANGVLSSVVITADCVDGVELRRHDVVADVTFTADRPYLVTDTLRVLPGATLTLAEGANLFFHDKAALVVEGTLRAEGTSEHPVSMRGDRTGAVVADISFDVMSNQWEGVYFAPESRGNFLSHTQIVNTCLGVELDSLAQLTLVNSRLTNSGSVLLSAYCAELTAVGSELSNARDALLLLGGSGATRVDRSTLANWYLFSFPSMAIVQVCDGASLDSLSVTNSVIYGRGVEVAFPEVKADELLSLPVTFARCMFRSEGEDDANFIGCLWDADPMLEYSLTDYTFPYTPLPDSPALGVAEPSLDHPLLPPLDFRGRERGLTLGAYGPVTEPQMLN